MHPLKLFILGIIVTARAFAQSESPPVQVNQEWLTKTLNETNCLESEWRLRACLRGLNDVFKEITGRNVELLHSGQINELWEPRQGPDGKPVFKTENLVLAQLSQKGQQELNEASLKDYNHQLAFRLYMNNRFGDLVGGPFTEDDFKTAFDFVLARPWSDEEARQLTALFLSGEIRERTHDPYAFLSVESPAGTSLPNRPLSVVWNRETFVIERVRPGSYYDKAGIHVGMSVDKVGDEKLTPQNIDNLLTAQQKDPSKLTVYRNGPDTKSISLPPAASPALPGVYHYSFRLAGKRVAVMELLSFSVANICETTKETLKKIASEKPNSLIVDLRGNGGGALEAVQCIGGALFGPNLTVGWEVLLPGTLAYEMLKKDRQEVLETKTVGPRLIDVPVTFLINANSGSSSEVMVGFAKYGLNDVFLVGQKTFGKGIGQITSGAVYRESPLEGFRLTSTFMRMHMPNGETYHLKGVAPDFVVDSPIPRLKKHPYVARFAEQLGEAFLPEPDGRKFTPNGARNAEISRLNRCAKRLDKRPITDPETWRWLQDQQLRKAALVSVCQLGGN